MARLPQDPPSGLPHRSPDARHPPRHPPRLRQARKRRAAATIDDAILTALIAIPVLGAVAATGDRVRSLLVAIEETLGDGVSGVVSSTQDRLFRNRSALPYTGIAVGDFTVKVGAQPPGGGVSASIATGSAAGRCGTSVSSIGANATCNVRISITRPTSTVGTNTLLVRHLPSGAEAAVTLLLNGAAPPQTPAGRTEPPSSAAQAAKRPRSRFRPPADVPGDSDGTDHLKILGIPEGLLLPRLQHPLRRPRTPSRVVSWPRCRSSVSIAGAALSRLGALRSFLRPSFVRPSLHLGRPAAR